MEERKKFSLTAANLRWIAIITMVINHFCFAVNKKLGIDNYFFSDIHWYITRISFVIFAYQIAEGMHYTKNRMKYILSLFIFAFVSETSFDLFRTETLFDFSNQNVVFNLAIGALTIAIIDKLNKKPLYALLVTIAGMVICVLINANYSFMGEALIVSFYYFRENKKKQLIISGLVFTAMTYMTYLHIYAGYSLTLKEILSVDYGFWSASAVQLHGLLAWPLFILYNGEKGKNVNKWFFYLFYPAHLILLYLLFIVLQMLLH